LANSSSAYGNKFAQISLQLEKADHFDALFEFEPIVSTVDDKALCRFQIIERGVKTTA
jgi:hypothetical protein